MTTEECLVTQVWRCHRCNGPVDHFTISVSKDHKKRPGFTMDFNCHGQWDSAFFLDIPMENLAAVYKFRKEIELVKPFRTIMTNSPGIKVPALPSKPPAVRPILGTGRRITFDD